MENISEWKLILVVSFETYQLELFAAWTLCVKYKCKSIKNRHFEIIGQQAMDANLPSYLGGGGVLYSDVQIEQVWIVVESESYTGWRPGPCTGTPE